MTPYALLVSKMIMMMTLTTGLLLGNNDACHHEALSLSLSLRLSICACLCLCDVITDVTLPSQPMMSKQWHTVLQCHGVFLSACLSVGLSVRLFVFLYVCVFITQ